MIKELYNPLENLTENENDAESMWKNIQGMMERAGKSNILENPTVVDLGGGYAEFTKFLKKEGINCASIDIQELKATSGSNQVRADMYKMPFADESVDIINACGSLDSSIYQHDFPKLLLEIARVLKRGGILSVTNELTPEGDEDFDDNFTIISESNDCPLFLEKK